MPSFALEALDRELGHDLVERRLHHLGGERLGAQRLELAVLAHPRRIAGEKMQIRAVALEYLGEIGVDGGHGGFRSRGGLEGGGTLIVGDVALKLALVGGVVVGLLGIDFLGLDRREQRLIHELHAVLLAHLQLARDLVRLIGHDQLADGLGEHHDLADRAPAALIGSLQRAPG